MECSRSRFVSVVHPFVLLVFTCLATNASDDAWQLVRTGTRSHLNGVSYGSGYFVAVGDEGSVLRSSDGISWQYIPTTITNAIRAVSHGNGTFIALARGTQSATSTDTIYSHDGLTWKRSNQSFTNELTKPCFGNGAFVAISAPTGVAVSTDATSWRYKQLGYVRSLTFGAGQFVASGSAQSIWTSVDGSTWTERTSFMSPAFECLTYGSGKFVGINNWIYWSTDALSWNVVAWPPSLSSRGLVYGNGLFVATGPIFPLWFFTFDDNLQYIESSLAPSSLVNDIVYGSNQFVAVGQNGLILTSADGRDWKCRSAGCFLEHLATSATAFVGLSSSNIATSTDAILWTTHPTFITNALASIVVGHNKAVAVGTSGAVLSSTNMEKWTYQHITTNDLLSVTYGNDTFVATGRQGTVLASTNGSEWIVSNVGRPTSDLVAVSFGNGRFLAADQDGFTFSAVTPDVWARSYPAYWGIQAATFARGAFLFATIAGSVQPGLLLATIDGRTMQPVWSELHIPKTSFLGIQTLNGSVWAVGTNGTIVASSDLTRWTVSSTGRQLPLSDIAYRDGTYVAVSRTGSALISGVLAPVATPTLTLINDHHYLALTFQRLKSTPLDSYSAIVSTNCLDWNVVPTTFTTVDTVDRGPVELITIRDIIPTDAAPRRFFRLRVTTKY